MAVSKRYRAIAASLLAILLLILLQANFGRDWTLWHQFLALAKPSFSTFRDNSLFNLVSSTWRAVIGTHPSDMITAITLVLDACMVLWFGIRFIQRERLFAALCTKEPATDAVREFRFHAHFMDALALSLLISPMLWEHHFVLAMPLVVWAAATVGKNTPWLVAVAAALMLAIPTFDLFLVSFHRLAGLLLLILVTAPAAIYARPTKY